MSSSTLTAPAAVVSVGPIVLAAPGRPVDLQLRVTAPVTGDKLPIVLLSHGLGQSNHLSSLNGYGPLAQSWAAGGFVVVQPTHMDSRTLGLSIEEMAELPHWRSRAEDMSLVIDRLDAVEAAVPELAGRLDRDRIAVAGHSMGGHTVSLLLGMRQTDPRNGGEVNLTEPRIKAGVLLAAPGGGEDVTDFVRDNYPFMTSADFSAMTTPALVVAGDADASEFLTTRGPGWHAEPYHRSPGPKSLLTLFGAEHGLGGIAGYDAAETTDENPARAEAIMRLTAAYLHSALDPADSAWKTACEELAAAAEPQGRIESK